MLHENVYHDYFDWLCEKVSPSNCHFQHRELLSILNDIDFIIPVGMPNIINDDNRASNGENLRWHYVCDGGSREILELDKPCSVLELLIAISNEFESITDDYYERYNASYWFWMMIENLDLMDMIDGYLDLDKIYENIETFMFRRYDEDGSNGGIIVIPRCHKDLTNMELWNQMCLYLDEMM